MTDPAIGSNAVAFNGSLSLQPAPGKTLPPQFQVSGSSIVTNAALVAGQSYSFNLVATQVGATGSPLTQLITVNVAAASGFTGTLTLQPLAGQTLPAYFQLSGNNIVTNSIVPAGTYSFNVVATQSGVAPFTQQYTIVVNAVQTSPTITGLSLSGFSFVPSAPTGTLIGVVTVNMTGGSFTGALSLTGTNASSFQFSGNNLLTNGVLAAGTYNINIVATQAAAVGSPFTQAEVITGAALAGHPDPVTYTISYSTSAAGPWTTAASGLMNTSDVITGLSTGISYFIQVVANDAILGISGLPAIGGPFATTFSGESAQGASLTTTVGTIIDANAGIWSLTNSPAPGGVTGVSSTGATSTTLGLSWTAPVGPQGLEVKMPNGTLTGSSVTILLYWNHTVYYQGLLGWFFWNGTTWVTTSDPRVIATESTQGTTVANTTGVITDASLGTWMLVQSVTAGLQAKHNSVVDTSTSQIQLLLYWNHTVYEQNLVGWFKWNGTAWTIVTGDPRITQTPSPSGTTLNSTTGTILDNNLGIWQLISGTSGLVADLNGSPAGSTTNVVLLLFFNGVIYEQNANLTWGSWNGTTWISTTDPRVVSASPDGSTLNTTTGTIRDAALNVWSLSNDPVNGIEVLENGAPAGFSANVILLLWFGGVIYQENNALGWWSWTGGTWLGVAGDPRGTVTGGGGTGTNPAGLLFRDEFDTLSLFDFNNPQLGGKWKPGGTSNNTDQGSAGPDISSWAMNPFFSGTPFNVYSVANSILRIEFMPTPPQFKAACGNLDYVTGNLHTQSLFSRQFGYIECRARLPGNVPGIGGSFWLLAESGIWPGEIDINEWGVPVSPGQTSSRQNVYHPQAVISGPSLWIPDNYFNVDTPTTSNFHTYGLDWRADGCDFYMDEVKMNSGAPTPAILQLPMYLIIQVNSGESTVFSNGPVTNPELLPAFAEFDYVRWWDSRASKLAAGL